MLLNWNVRLQLSKRVGFLWDHLWGPSQDPWIHKVKLFLNVHRKLSKDSSPLLMGEWQERILGSPPDGLIHVVSCEKLVFLCSLQYLQADQWLRIPGEKSGHREAGLPIVHQVSRKMRQAYFPLDCVSPMLSYMAQWVNKFIYLFIILQ